MVPSLRDLRADRARKTSVLKNIMVQRAYQGYGFTFVDPKGEACYEILRQLPEHRLDDLVWVDPDPDESDYIAGMNFIDVGDADGNEITRELEDLKGALADEDYWGCAWTGFTRL